jgi:hypothetical protein
MSQEKNKNANKEQKMSEHALMNLIRLHCDKEGHISFRYNVGKFQTIDGRWIDCGPPKGHSDLIIFTKWGKAFFIEVKIYPNLPTKEQISFLNLMRSMNYESHIIYDIETLKSILTNENAL